MVFKISLTFLADCYCLTATDDASQGVVIVPFPEHPNLYFVFTTNGGIVNPGEGPYYDFIEYSIVDMTADNGFGDVVSLNIPLEDSEGYTNWLNMQGIEAITVRNVMIVCLCRKKETYQKPLFTLI